MKRYKIALFHAKPYDKEFFEIANNQYQFDIQYFEEPLNLETCLLARGFDVVCVFVNDPVTAAIVEILYREGVKLIALRSTGYNHVDLEAASGKITIVRVPEYSPHAVAEFAVGLMLSLNRKIHHAYSRVRDNNFSITGLMGFDMVNKTAGVIGAGRIGKVVIEILKGFGMKVIAYDALPEQVRMAGCPFADLDTLYRESDIITLHCPLTPESTHMINSTSIAKMKKGVMIINTGRGGIVNSLDLVQALKTGKVGAAGLDVYEEEADYFYKDLSLTMIDDDTLARLLSFPNVLITSHQAFFTQEALTGIASITLENVKEFFEGKSLKNEISYEKK